MRYRSVCTAIVICFLVSNTFAQERLTSISVFGSFTTSSKLFFNPNDPDETVRGQFLPLNDIFSFGTDVRQEIKSLGAQFGLSVEYIAKSDLFNVPTAVNSIPVRDGFTVVPIELSGYFVLPVGNEHLRVYLGGGGGLYAGRRIHEYPGVGAPTTSSDIGYGIHVLTGTEYFFSPLISIRGELKFRDVQFSSVNQFKQSTAIYNGEIYSLDQTPLPSRLNIDGMTGTISLACHF